MSVRVSKTVELAESQRVSQGTQNRPIGECELVCQGDRHGTDTVLVGQGVHKGPTGPIGSCRSGRVKLYKAVPLVESQRVGLLVRNGEIGGIRTTPERL